MIKFQTVEEFNLALFDARVEKLFNQGYSVKEFKTFQSKQSGLITHIAYMVRGV